MIQTVNLLNIFGDMIYTFDDIEYIEQNLKKAEKLDIFQKAFEHEWSNTICKESKYISVYDNFNDISINMSDIATNLIHTAGRYCDRYLT
jgi:hypothetical protein